MLVDLGTGWDWSLQDHQSDLLMEIHCVAVMVEALMEQPTAHPADTHDPGFRLMANEWLREHNRNRGRLQKPWS